MFGLPRANLLAGCLIWLYQWIVGGWNGMRNEPMIIAVAATLALARPTTPGGVGLAALAIMILGYARWEKELTTIGLAFFPMFVYIYNFWSDHQLAMTGDSRGGITWKAMVEAAESDQSIARRVELYRYRVPEELYNWQEDPDGLNNLVNDPAYADELEKLRGKMLEMMQRYHDPACDAYRNRSEPGVVRAFMEAQRAKAKTTKPVERF